MGHFISQDFLQSRNWVFSHKDKDPVCYYFRFSENGSVSGYDHPNEKYWELENNCLLILNDRRVTTAKFEKKENLDDGRVVLTGYHLPNSKIIFTFTEVKDDEFPIRPGTKDFFKERIKSLDWEIGDHTYGKPEIIDNHLNKKLKIGRFTSIANGVKIVFSNHRTDLLTSYPFQTLRGFWPSAPEVADHISNGDVVIGNDVWIGTDVLITSGITIGDGAVIGAKSIVTHDVPPYAIVVGVPAKVIRYRFPPQTILALCRAAWWNLPDKIIDKLLPKIMSTDPKPLLQEIRFYKKYKKLSI